MCSLSLVPFADPEGPYGRTGPSVCGLAAHLQGGLWPAGLVVLGKGGGGLRPVRVQACTVTLLGPSLLACLCFPWGHCVMLGPGQLSEVPRHAPPLKLWVRSPASASLRAGHGDLRGRRAGQVSPGSHITPDTPGFQELGLKLPGIPEQTAPVLEPLSQWMQEDVPACLLLGRR